MRLALTYNCFADSAVTIPVLCLLNKLILLLTNLLICRNPSRLPTISFIPVTKGWCL